MTIRSCSQRRRSRWTEWKKELHGFMRSEGHFDKGTIALKLTIGEKLTRPEALAHIWKAFEYDTTLHGPSKKWKQSFTELCGRPFPKSVAAHMDEYHREKRLVEEARWKNGNAQRNTEGRANFIRMSFLAKVTWLNTFQRMDKLKVDHTTLDRIRLVNNEWHVPKNFLCMFRTEKQFSERFLHFVDDRIATKCLICDPEFDMAGPYKVMWAITPNLIREQVLIGMAGDIQKSLIMGDLNTVNPLFNLIKDFSEKTKVAVPISYFRGLKCEEAKNKS